MPISGLKNVVVQSKVQSQNTSLKHEHLQKQRRREGWQRWEGHDSHCIPSGASAPVRWRHTALSLQKDVSILSATGDARRFALDMTLLTIGENLPMTRTC